MDPGMESFLVGNFDGLLPPLKSVNILAPKRPKRHPRATQDRPRAAEEAPYGQGKGEGVHRAKYNCCMLLWVFTTPNLILTQSGLIGFSPSLHGSNTPRGAKPPELNFILHNVYEAMEARQMLFPQHSCSGSWIWHTHCRKHMVDYQGRRYPF